MSLYRLSRYYRNKEQISDRFDLYLLKRLETAGPMPRFYSLLILWSVKEESLGGYALLKDRVPATWRCCGCGTSASLASGRWGTGWVLMRLRNEDEFARA